MKNNRQLSFLPDSPKPEKPPKAPAGRRKQPDPPGFPIDPDKVVVDIDEAIQNLGQELGRIGTLLDHVNDYGLLDRFSQVYLQQVKGFADLLLKQKALQDNPDDPLLALLGPVLDRLNEETEIEL